MYKLLEKLMVVCVQHDNSLSTNHNAILVPEKYTNKELQVGVKVSRLLTPMSDYSLANTTIPSYSDHLVKYKVYTEMMSSHTLKHPTGERTILYQTPRQQIFQNV